MGSICPWCQVPELRRGFEVLGHKHTDNWDHPDVAFVFVGNPPFESYIEAARDKRKRFIFNVLDLAPHCPEHPDIVARFKEQLPLAARVTCISDTVGTQLQALGLKAETTFYPMKPVKHTGVNKYPRFKAMLCGRVNDPNKRAGVAINALIRAGYKEDEIVIVGSENPRYGSYLGIVDDNTLSDLYNSVDYVMMLSKEEGIGLPACEAAICGAIPIVAPDLTTFDELWVKSALGLHYQALTSADAIAHLMRAINVDPAWKTAIKQDMVGYGELFLRPRFDAVNVARRIIDVFHTT